jgi:hypothetical protein
VWLARGTARGAIEEALVEIVIAFMLTSFILGGSLVLLREDCSWNFDWIGQL